LAADDERGLLVGGAGGWSFLERFHGRRNCLTACRVEFADSKSKAAG
jgi:hypothetical protein